METNCVTSNYSPTQYSIIVIFRTVCKFNFPIDLLEFLWILVLSSTSGVKVSKIHKITYVAISSPMKHPVIMICGT